LFPIGGSNSDMNLWCFIFVDQLVYQLTSTYHHFGKYYNFVIYGGIRTHSCSTIIDVSITINTTHISSICTQD
jgi:hypothetical protein